MSYSSRPLPSHLRQPSISGNTNSASTGQSQVLLARINEKKLELEDLRQLRDLSAGLAGQMSVLEEKLATLADGTEGMCCTCLYTVQKMVADDDYGSCCACAQ
jgi:DASH complex subunit DAD2